MAGLQLVTLGPSDTLVKLQTGTHSGHGGNSFNQFVEEAVAEMLDIASEFSVNDRVSAVCVQSWSQQYFP